MNKNMHIIFIILISFACLISGQAQVNDFAQTTLMPIKDSLVINREDGQKITMIWPAQKRINRQVSWEQLLEDFQADFRKVKDNIPDYDFYRIQYLQKQNLIVDEITGRESYTVNETDGLDYIKSNLCTIKGSKINMHIEFSDANELLDPSLKQDISKAISEVKHTFYLSLAPERFHYDVETGKMKKNPWPKVKFFVPLGAQVGLLKNEPYVELRAGLGLALGKTHYVALNYDLMTHFDVLENRTQYDSYVGLKTGSLGAGFGSDFGFKVTGGIEAYDDLIIRAGINYRTSGGTKLGVRYYIRNKESSTIKENVVFGFNVGFGF